MSHRALRKFGEITILLASFSSAALATVTVDRDFRFGEGSGENGSPGDTVGIGVTVPGGGDTLDEVGPMGAYLDLLQSGNPTYVDVNSGAKMRDGTSPGDVGIQFNGVNMRLQGFPLNRPDELETIIGAYPLNYTGITGHGTQLWVYPDQAGLDAGVFQSILFDTILSGGPAINAAGQWTQINSDHGDGTDGIAAVPASVAVAAGDTWYHVMHHHTPRSGDNFTSVVYVNGIAVSANDDTIPLGAADDDDHVGLLVVGAAEVIGDGTTAEFGDYFQGAVDNAEMYVFGDNMAQGGQNWGEFSLFEDNEWIRNEVGVVTLGDVNLDGEVNGNGFGSPLSDDVAAFVDGWKMEKEFQGAHNTLTVGDLETWGWGDLNLDGQVNFSDWYILRAAHPDGDGLDLGALLPEPSSGVLLLFVAMGMGMLRREWACCGED